jgi:hypothetical protein
LRNSDHVPPGHRDRKGLLLNGGGNDILLIRQRANERLGEAEIEERIQRIIFL